MVNPAVAQACTRCGAYWPVSVVDGRLVPARWCPYCQGGLSVPFGVRPDTSAFAQNRPNPHRLPQFQPESDAAQQAQQQQVQQQAQGAPSWGEGAGGPPPPAARVRPVITGTAAPGGVVPGSLPPGGVVPGDPGSGGAGSGGAVQGGPNLGGAYGPASAPGSTGPPACSGGPAGTRGRSVLPRGYRWVARKPQGPRQPRPVGAVPGGTDAGSSGLPGADRFGAQKRSADPGPTPFYTQIPRWTLQVDPPERSESGRSGPEPDPARLAADRTRFVLTTTMVLFVLAAVGELVRYVLLLRNNSGHLLNRFVVAASDAAVLVFGYASMLFVVLAAISCAMWLVRARRQVFGARGQEEPRGRRILLAGMLIPIVNLVYPGVFLAEFSRGCGTAAGAGSPEAAFQEGLGSRDSAGRGSAGPGSVLPDATPRGRLRTLTADASWWVRRQARRMRRGYRRLRDGSRLYSVIRIWWFLWVLVNVAVAGVVLQRLGDSAQARADGVLYSLYADVLACAVVVVTRILVARGQGAADSVVAGGAVSGGVGDGVLSDAVASDGTDSAGVASYGAGPDDPPLHWVLDTATWRAGSERAAPEAAATGHADSDADADAEPERVGT